MNRELDNTDICRTILEIQDKIDAGEAIVLTATEISAKVHVVMVIGIFRVGFKEF